jgi:hypothetical protein
VILTYGPRGRTRRFITRKRWVESGRCPPGDAEDGKPRAASALLLPGPWLAAAG